MRIAVATVDIAGPYHCGGVGAAYQGLALELARAGHDVSVFYTHHNLIGDVGEWTRWYEARGIRFQHAPQRNPGPVWYADRKDASARAYRALRDNGTFDVIHFHDWLGLAFYSIAAKRLGLAFEDTTICIGTHGPMAWSRSGDRRFTSTRSDLIVDYMEQRCIEGADAVVCPSTYIGHWIHDRGWRLPDDTYVIPNLLTDPSGEPANAPSDRTTEKISELVFFGRLDVRKGLDLFCSAVDALCAGGRTPAKVSFLGSSSIIGGKPSAEYIGERSRAWGTSVHVDAQCDRPSALAYLKAGERLAVIPSRIDNLPCTVQECVQEGIPFISSNVGGIREIVCEDDHERCTINLTVDDLTESLASALDDGWETALPRVASREAGAMWAAFHEKMHRPRTRSAARPGETLAVCMAHYERPQELAVMLDSIAAQTRMPDELIVVDDGSTSPDAAALLDALESGARPLPVARVVVQRTANAGPGPARNLAARSAASDCLLFVDDDDFLNPTAVETFMNAAEYGGDDVLVSFYEGFRGAGAPAACEPGESYLPLGPALAAGLIYPELGGTVIFCRRGAFERSGGFSEIRDVDEDWEFLLRAAASGEALGVIPETLFLYREKADGRSHADNRYERNASRIALFESLLPPELQALASLAYVQLAGADTEAKLKRRDRVQEMVARAAKMKAAESRRKPE